MLHPSTRLKWISDTKGYGIFALTDIPRGTITFAQDPLDIVVPADSEMLQIGIVRAAVEKYGYLNAEGEGIVSWDFGKYMNHCCYANTLTTGYGFEIAVQDIAAGDEITDDYGIFALHHEMKIDCSRQGCRKRISGKDFDANVAQWDQRIKDALTMIHHVDQPLWELISAENQSKIQSYLSSGQGYVSVSSQKPESNSRPTPQPGIHCAVMSEVSL